jgi:hypothetical protein
MANEPMSPIVKEWADKVKAHLSEEKPRCEFELYIEKYFGLTPSSTNENTVIPADFGVLCDLLCGFKQELEKQKP